MSTVTVLYSGWIVWRFEPYIRRRSEPVRDARGATYKRPPPPPEWVPRGSEENSSSVMLLHFLLQRIDLRRNVHACHDLFAVRHPHARLRCQHRRPEVVQERVREEEMVTTPDGRVVSKTQLGIENRRVRRLPWTAGHLHAPA